MIPLLLPALIQFAASMLEDSAEDVYRRHTSIDDSHVAPSAEGLKAVWDAGFEAGARAAIARYNEVHREKGACDV